MKQHLIYVLGPLYIILTISEITYLYMEGKETGFWKDIRRNIAIGAVLFVIGFFSQLLMLFSFELVYRWRLFTMGNTPLCWIINFIASDVAYYWYHRTAHKVNWFWMSHQVHHSSEEYNLTIAMRQSWTEKLAGEFLFWLWIPLLGINPVIMMINYQLTRFYQGLLHTEKVGRLPRIIEFIFNTPSLHRVHHASNPEYIDKNHGGVLIIWDRLFGTFCRENVKPRYGLTEKHIYKSFAAIQFRQWGVFLFRLINCHSVKGAVKCFTGKPGEQGLPASKMPVENFYSMAAGKTSSYTSFSQPVVNTPLHLYV